MWEDACVCLEQGPSPHGLSAKPVCAERGPHDLQLLSWVSMSPSSCSQGSWVQAKKTQT